MIDVKKLNKSLDKYLDEGESIDDFKFIKDLNDIIIRNTKDFEVPKFRKKINLECAASLVYSFFLSINKDYATYFEEKLNDNVFSFSKNYELGLSSYDYKNHKSFINIPIIGGVVDSYTILHEIMHDTNMDINKDTLCHELLTETISLLSEILFQDFLIKHKLFVHDNRKTMKNNFGVIYDMSWSTSLELSLIERYIEYGFIDNNFLNSLYSKYDENIINNFIGEEYIFKNDFYLRYIIGYVLAFYMYDRIKQNPKYINELFDINSMMNEFYFESILTYLDLEYMVDSNDNLLFTDDCLRKLEKSYKKVLKEF